MEGLRADAVAHDAEQLFTYGAARGGAAGGVEVVRAGGEQPDAGKATRKERTPRYKAQTHVSDLPKQQVMRDRQVTFEA